ncbi:UNVERIFIED_ORG: hypothetical protein FHU01_1877 [Citrobacter freundii]
MTPLKLSTEQIKALAAFAEEEGQPSYMIAHTTIPEFEADDGSVIPEYTGLLCIRNPKNTAFYSWINRHYSSPSVRGCDNAGV